MLLGSLGEAARVPHAFHGRDPAGTIATKSSRHSTCMLKSTRDGCWQIFFLSCSSALWRAAFTLLLPSCQPHSPTQLPQ